MALCRRVAYETMNMYGSQVAYQIRFDTTRTERTRILFLTEGVLLRQLSGDPLLRQYDVIVVDEVTLLISLPRYVSENTLLHSLLCRRCMNGTYPLISCSLFCTQSSLAGLS